MDKYHEVIGQSAVTTDDAFVKAEVERILDKNLKESMNADIYKFLFNCIDLTTLRATDSPRSVADFTERVNAFEEEHPEMKNVAAICVYPNFAQVVRAVLEVSSVDIACVAGGFPSSQTFPEVKVAEVALAVEGGADEIDIVLNVGYFLDGDYEGLCDEIAEIKHSCRDARLKVILESGALKTAENIRNAAILSMYSGADFIKTSTGKIDVAATPEAAVVMCEAIRDFYNKTGRKVGFKAAGGVRTAEDAALYYTIVEEILGKEWLTTELFRIGASSAANNLLSAIEGKEIKYY